MAYTEYCTVLCVLVLVLVWICMGHVVPTTSRLFYSLGSKGLSFSTPCDDPQIWIQCWLILLFEISCSQSTKGSNLHVDSWCQGLTCYQDTIVLRSDPSSSLGIGTHRFYISQTTRAVYVFQPRENPTKMSLFSSDIHARQPSKPLLFCGLPEYVCMLDFALPCSLRALPI